jgi:hypothetical protein
MRESTVLPITPYAQSLHLANFLISSKNDEIDPAGFSLAIKYLFT